VGAFFREMLRVGIYKRSQGRITRQVTFAALAVAIALGLMRLSAILINVDPVVSAKPAIAVCTAKDGRVEADATLKVSGGSDKTATVAIRAGENLTKVAEDVNARTSTTGVIAAIREEEGKTKLVLSSTAVGNDGFLQLESPKNVLQIEGLDADGIARGRNALNLGLRFLIPGVLLFGGLWMSYRVVNVPSFADFLVAVEAEMNKVSWPTRSELFRASMVVLILIISLAIILFAFDLSWKLIFTKVLHIL
jgi:preprotein translocase SecE subunit